MTMKKTIDNRRGFETLVQRGVVWLREPADHFWPK
jgi:hypothetical protein